jgi:hypothetical protein
MSYVSPP